jgi:hypothetical protein
LGSEGVFQVSGVRFKEYLGSRCLVSNTRYIGLIGSVQGFSVQVSGISKQMTGDRKQPSTSSVESKSDRVLHLSVFTICLLSSDR